MSSCWTMSPLRRKPWDSNPQVACATDCFQDSVLIRPDDFRLSCGSWNRTNIKTFRASRPTVRRSRKMLFSSGGRNRTYGLLIQSQASLPTATTPELHLHLKSALRELNPPRQFGRLAPLPLGQEHTQRKERESNPQGLTLDCFRDSCHRQLACPSVTSCGGRNRTCGIRV